MSTPKENPSVPPPEAPAAAKGPTKPEEVGRKVKALKPKAPAPSAPETPSAPAISRSVFNELWNVQ